MQSFSDCPKTLELLYVLRDDGMSYRGYVEQLTYLLFLKMADERSKPPYASPARSPTSTVGRAYSRKTATTCSTTIAICWKTSAKKGHARSDLHEGPEQVPGPLKLRRLVVDLIDKETGPR